jgi:hypothetical protein
MHKMIHYFNKTNFFVAVYAPTCNLRNGLRRPPPLTPTLLFLILCLLQFSENHVFVSLVRPRNPKKHQPQRDKGEEPVKRL